MINNTNKSTVILLAEDDPGDQELIRRALEDSCLYNDLRIVNDGEEALNYLLRRECYQDPETSPRPQLMLLDLNMPRIDGKQVLREMHMHPRLKDIKVVVLTTSRDEQDKIDSYKLGCCMFVTKPNDMDKFTRVIEELQNVIQGQAYKRIGEDNHGA